MLHLPVVALPYLGLREVRHVRRDDFHEGSAFWVEVQVTARRAPTLTGASWK